MTPDKQLDQIEPVLADVAQKTDRLIESNGLIFQLALENQAQIQKVVQQADSTARGLANLTVNVNQRFDQLTGDMNQRFGEVDNRFDNLTINVEQRFGEVDQRFDSLTTDVNQQFSQVDQRFDHLNADMNQRFGQQQNQLNDVQSTMNTGFRQLDLKIDTKVDGLQQEIKALKDTQTEILTILRERLK